GEDKDAKVEAKKEKVTDEKPRPGFRKEEVKEVKTLKEKGTEAEVKTSWERKKTFPETKAQNGERVSELTSQKLKHTEKTFG
ncbi:hypothetical protein FKM82_027794, partial [Ascaphus truei]